MLPPTDPRLEQATTLIMRELDAWLADGIRLEKAEGSAWHRMNENGFLLLTGGKSIKMSKRPQIFVVQHDWASAFKGAEDFNGGDFQLPFDRACFEFRISGKRVCCMVMDEDGRKGVWPVVELSRGWVVPITMFFLKDGEWSPEITGSPFDERYGVIAPFMAEQIKAICVSLEAEVAAAEIVATSAKLNAARARRGKGPLPDYSVLYLNRAARSVGVGGVEHSTTRRLHFRRGHWRHLGEDRRTWVRWCLVGNPDLGFIDKEYRL